jgi:hypothetical protein
MMDESQIEVNKMILEYQNKIKDLENDLSLNVNTYRQLYNIYKATLDFYEQRKRNYLVKIYG